MPPKCLENRVILCIERSFSKKKCYSPKLKHFGPPIFGLAEPLLRTTLTNIAFPQINCLCERHVVAPIRVLLQILARNLLQKIRKVTVFILHRFSRYPFVRSYKKCPLYLSTQTTAETVPQSTILAIYKHWDP